MTETTELADGINAVSERVQTLINNVDRFDVLDTFARGPMVVNERKDYFSDFAIKTWHGVGIFFIREGKIVDWYDYTIAMEADTDQSVLMHARARFCIEICISDWFKLNYGAPGRTRTCNPRLRRPMLYPVELRARRISLRQSLSICINSKPV